MHTESIPLTPKPAQRRTHIYVNPFDPAEAAPADSASTSASVIAPEACASFETQPFCPSRRPALQTVDAHPAPGIPPQFLYVRPGHLFSPTEMRFHPKRR